MYVGAEIADCTSIRRYYCRDSSCVQAIDRKLYERKALLAAVSG